MEITQEAALVLGKPIPDNPASVWKLIWEMDHLKFRLYMALAQANHDLSTRCGQVLVPKNGDMTELDRTTLLRTGTADQQQAVDKLTFTSSLLESRITLLLSWAQKLDNEKHKEQQFDGQTHN